jgi:hypothetical protein
VTAAVLGLIGPFPALIITGSVIGKNGIIIVVLVQNATGDVDILVSGSSICAFCQLQWGVMVL